MIEIRGLASAQEVKQLTRALEAETKFQVVATRPTTGRNTGVWALRVGGLETTQKEFAERIGYSLRQVQRVEAGNTEVTPRFEKAASDALLSHMRAARQ